MRGPHNRFKVGDEVVDFRGDRARVVAIEESKHWRTKSHRVEVEWLDPSTKHQNPDKRSYYEEVFEPCNPSQAS